jgi:hypothetical protein
MGLLGNLESMDKCNILSYFSQNIYLFNFDLEARLNEFVRVTSHMMTSAIDHSHVTLVLKGTFEEISLVKCCDFVIF